MVVNLIKLNSMKNFDLEAARRGATVCTRDGCSVRIVCTDCRGEDPIVALVDYETGEDVSTYNSRGRYYESADSDLDLFMRDDNYPEKLARGEYGNHIDEATEKVDPVIKEKLTTDREYWRRVYAGYALAGACARVSRLSAEGVKFAIAHADALLEELEKRRRNCEKAI